MKKSAQRGKVTLLQTICNVGYKRWNHRTLAKPES